MQGLMINFTQMSSLKRVGTEKKQEERDLSKIVWKKTIQVLMFVIFNECHREPTGFKHSPMTQKVETTN